jgi:hypothetical protein
MVGGGEQVGVVLVGESEDMIRMHASTLRL